jgi:predicted enzyme related to lactoylglutathione lyase
MRINLVSIHVDDQERALKFYTEVLGFLKSQEIPVGEFRWLTVRSPEEGRRSCRSSRTTIPREVSRLKTAGVKFTLEPTAMGPVTVAILADTCGNLIQIYQPA